MNGIEFLAGPVAQALGWALLHLLWQGALVAALLAATLSLLSKQRANVRYTVSCAALALLLTLGFVTAWRVYEPAPAQVRSTTAAAATASLPDLDTWATPTKATWKDRLTSATLTARAWIPQIVLVWLVGVLLLSVRLLTSWMRAHRLARRGATPASQQWQRALLRLSTALHVRRAVTLLESAAVEVPTVIGWMRPVVLLPASTLTGLSTEQIEMILAHELAHIRRHDFFVNLLQAVVETLMFYHPAVWWMSRQVRIERENCCDDLAVSVCGNPLQYARALTRLEELRGEPVQIALAASGGSLLERVRRLVISRPDATVGAPRYAAGLAVVTVLALLLAGPSLPLLAQREETRPAPKSAPSAATITVDVSDASHDDESDDANDDVSDDVNVDIVIDTDIDTGAYDDLVVTPPPPPPPAAPGRAPVAITRVDVPAAPHPHPAVAPEPAPFALAVPLPPDAPDVMDALSPATMAAAIDIALAPRMVERVRERSPRSDKNDRKLSSGKLTVDELIALRVHGITPEYIDEMRGILGADLTLGDLTSTKVHGIDAKYIRDMRALFGNQLSTNDIVGLKVHSITPAYVEEMRASGLGTLSQRDIMGMKVQGVTPAYIREMRTLGLGALQSRDLMGMKVQGVTPAYVREMRQLDLGALDTHDLIGMKVQGITPSYVREMRALGLGTLSSRDLVSLKVQGIDDTYVREMREAGVELTTARNAISLKVLGVTPEFVRELKAAGYTNLTARELIRLAGSGINSDFIRDMQQYRSKN